MGMLRFPFAAFAACAMGAIWAPPPRAQVQEWMIFKDHRSIQSQTADGDSAWISTLDGMVVLDMASGKASLPTPQRPTGGPFDASAPDWRNVRSVRTAKSRKCALEYPASEVLSASMILWTYAGGKWGAHPFPDGAGEATRSGYGIFDLACGEDGDAWISSGSGLIRFDGNAWDLSLAQPPAGDEDAIRPERLALDPDGALWVLYSNRVYRLESGAYKSVFDRTAVGRTFGRGALPTGLTEGEAVVNFGFDAQGALWVLGSFNAYRSPDRGKTWSMSSLGYTPSNFGYPTLLAFPESGGTWIRLNGNLKAYNGSGWTTDSVSLKAIGVEAITGMVIDRRGKKWVGTPKGLYTGEGADWNRHDLFPGKTNFADPALFAFGPGATVWAASTAGRLGKYDGTAWSEADTVSYAQVSDLVVDGGELLIGSSLGPQTLADGQRKFLPGFDTLYAQVGGALGNRFAGVNDMAVEKPGKTWFATNGGLVARENGRLTLYTNSDTPLAQGGIAAVAADSGIVWAADRLGVVRFDGTGWRRYPAFPENEDDGYDSTAMQLAVGGEHRLWALRKNKLFRLDGESWTLVYRESRVFSPQILKNGPAYRMGFDASGRLFLGTGYGLLVLDGKTWKSHYPLNSDLPSGRIPALGLDPNGNVWMASGSNVAVYRKGGLLLGGVLPKHTAAPSVPFALPLSGRILPGRSMSLPGAHWRAEIFALDGRRLRELAPEHSTDGSWRILWDGADGTGRMPPSGVFLFRFHSLGL
jgi:ligand-binding sensor domain-containing protein